MKITECNIVGLYIIEPRIFSDARGFFMESYKSADFADAFGVDIAFVQDNHSLSHEQGTIRGLHFQSPPYGQGKLVRCTRGKILDVAVDVRKNSPTYGQHSAVVLSSENAKQFWIPAGFLHGFITRTPMSEVQYKCTAPYMHACEGGVRWDDPDLAIDWFSQGLDEKNITISEKDAQGQSFADFQSPFSFGETDSGLGEKQ
ncbi:MAG: dTDP-4-dehydrorhamnose 3,5-epimerase [Robiginitomaculum sp.]|nr:MAG: dTDP-4-dehydrorhamnose 3,5-epimerase [Robiginitomaculum sp.]